MGGESSAENKPGVGPGPDPLQLLTAAKQGRLRKKKEHLSGWPERYFVLDGHELTYWKSPDKSTPDGRLDIASCSCTMQKGRVEDGTYSCFVVADSNNKWTLGSTDTDVIRSWVSAIEQSKSLFAKQNQTPDRKHMWMALDKKDLRAASAALTKLDKPVLCELAQTKQFVLRGVAASVKAAQSGLAMEPSPDSDGFSIGEFWRRLFEHIQGTEGSEILNDTLFFGLFIPDLSPDAERMMKQILLVLGNLDRGAWCLRKLELFNTDQFQHHELEPLCPPQCGLLLQPTKFCGDNFAHTNLPFPIGASASALSKELTVMLWLFLDGSEHEPGNRHIFSVGMDSGIDRLNGATLCINKGRIRWGTYCADGAHELETQQQLLCNRWQHVAVTFNAERSEKRIYIDGMLVQKGQNRARVGDVMVTTHKPLRLSEAECSFVLTGLGDYHDQSRWVVSDVLLSSKAASATDISTELRHQSKIRGQLLQERAGAGGEDSLIKEGLVYPSLETRRSWVEDEEPNEVEPHLNKVLVWWNAVMHNDSDLCLQLKVPGCPEGCYWEPPASLSDQNNMQRRLRLNLVEGALGFLEVLRQISKLDREKRINPAIANYLQLVRAQQAYPTAFISVPPHSSAAAIANLHRLDPVGFAVDCTTLLGRDDACLFGESLLDRTAQKHANLLTELLLKTMDTEDNDQEATLDAVGLTRRIQEQASEVLQIKTLYDKHLISGGRKPMLPEGSSDKPSPELLQFLHLSLIHI
eukprot:TRINITY_DN10346_c0_g6_i3.p1 TRINITY_DN10346_c0_g6~~TRINITY_DN10346_c0_g6_i3.p1  ORF type:complete len:750 (+),score=193.15 TRINITY_DN10346_c0_g6_i3:47-2296(+)